MTQREVAKAPARTAAAATLGTRRPMEERLPECRPEVSKTPRAELRRIVIEMIG